MENSSKSGTIKLPVQALNWSLIKSTKKLKKIVLQFEVEFSLGNSNIFSIVAYPMYKIKDKWEVGKRIPLDVKKDCEPIELQLPLTLGNLELSYKKIKSLLKKGNETLVFKAYLYDKNPHAAYTVTDNLGQNILNANPTPPGKPSSD